ncbi:hypothetical protein PBI_MARYV_148 [Mycobacterium phage MaryV]|nr:hypothetical protein PBI_MARYV_148 [Mycobacterium phage MaryV]
MAHRITGRIVDAKLAVLNGKLGFSHVEYNTVGSIRLYRAMGTVQIQRVVSEHGGITVLLYTDTLREAATFVDGMLAALRIMSE